MTRKIVHEHVSHVLINIWPNIQNARMKNEVTYGFTGRLSNNEVIIN